MDSHQTIVTAALAARSSGESPKKARWEARSETMRREISRPEVLERLEMPPEVGVSGLESDGGNQFFCGGGSGGIGRRARSARGGSHLSDYILNPTSCFRKPSRSVGRSGKPLFCSLLRARSALVPSTQRASYRRYTRQCGYLSSRYFGLRHFGQLYGYIFAVFSAGAALGPYVLGVCFDRFHSYDALFGYVDLLVLASGLIVSLGAYVFPVESDADVRLASAVRTPT